jgi:cellulose synthase/poly-beta-1,6-N-acetylglucosamine synthase-like glycosyltransferase
MAAISTALIIMKDILYYMMNYVRYLPYNIFMSILCNELSKKRRIKKRLIESTKVSAIRKHSLISVIIPCYNERNNITATIYSVLQDNNVEIIISDGGSTDGTIQLCKAISNCRIVTGGRNRAECQNLGFQIANGEIILFLHGDTLLPSKWGNNVREGLLNNQNAIGCFSFDIQSSDLKDSFVMRLISFGM